MNVYVTLIFLVRATVVTRGIAMNYEVLLSEIREYVIVVEADNENDAKTIAEETLSKRLVKGDIVPYYRSEPVVEDVEMLFDGSSSFGIKH
jgi:hypothetical protein